MFNVRFRSLGESYTFRMLRDEILEVPVLVTFPAALALAATTGRETEFRVRFGIEFLSEGSNDDIPLTVVPQAPQEVFDEASRSVLLQVAEQTGTPFPGSVSVRRLVIPEKQASCHVVGHDHIHRPVGLDAVTPTGAYDTPDPITSEDETVLLFSFGRDGRKESNISRLDLIDPGLFIPYTEHRRMAPQLADLKLVCRPGITRSNFPYCDNLNL